ncbi:uncharacterized protein [Spinacia oleracea]|uniref:Reverse transcriptase domain-containing protein n=1 Tax=Spinacia oleracea TaxID=3562 RepID=A0ABM3QXN4_SPIOL|nr:uncharacterized protein LOC130463100 [Spinacia oleracea]
MWGEIGDDVCKDILDFRNTGKLLKEINTTSVTLIPKGKCPESVQEYMPISCCNVVYKCISKVLCYRLRSILPDVIAQNQGAFVHNRFIAHNIMVFQDLAKGYERKNNSAGCLIKLDLQKPYDSCVRSPRFSLSINGTFHGFFEGKIGLRQGDPLSALLFVLCVEYLSRILMMVGEKEGFKFHPRCSASKLNILCYADDFILCCKVQRILDMTGFAKGCFPFRYLGIPICSKKISVAECEKIVEKMCVGIKWNGVADYGGLRKVAWNKENVWVRLIHSVYLKDQNWWGYFPKKGDSWYWKVICQVKELMKTYLSENQLRSLPTYSIKKSYCELVPANARVHWTNAVWGRLAQPKHRFIARLAVLGRLNTKYRLMQFGVSTDKLCLLCGLEVENHSHLFFGCQYNSRCCNMLLLV